MEFLVSTIQDLPAAAKWIIEASGEHIFLFYGEMGAGKTTLIKAICAALGSTDPVSSPTFSLVNEYSAAGSTIFHFDFYRLKNETEALDLGLEDYFYSGNYCLAEWPEKIPGLLPPSFLKISIDSSADGSRKLTLTVINAGRS